MPWAAVACAAASIYSAEAQRRAGSAMHDRQPLPKPASDTAMIESELAQTLRVNQRGVYLVFALALSLVGVAYEWLPRLLG